MRFQFNLDLYENNKTYYLNGFIVKILVLTSTFYSSVISGYFLMKTYDIKTHNVKYGGLTILQRPPTPHGEALRGYYKTTHA